jgi:hypothetical protein
MISYYSPAHFYFMKKSAKVQSTRIPHPFWETQSRPPNINVYFSYFGDPFIEKDGGFRTHNQDKILDTFVLSRSLHTLNTDQINIQA